MDIKRIKGLLKNTAWVLATAFLTAIFAFSAGKTLAFWVSDGETENLLHTGKLSAKIVERYTPPPAVYPGDTVEKTVNVENTGNVDSIIRVKVNKFWAAGETETGFVPAPEYDTENILIDYDTEYWRYDANDGYFYYTSVLSPGETTAKPLFERFLAANTIDNDFAGKFAVIQIDMESVQAGYGGVSLWDKTLEELRIEYDAPSSSPPVIPEARFAGPGEGFGFVSETQDIFWSFRNLLPGESRSQPIVLENAYARTVPFYLKAEYREAAGDPDEKQKVRRLLKELVSITVTDEKGGMVYQGPVWGNLDSETEPSMKDYIYLGDFEPLTPAVYNLTVQVREELCNEFAEISGKITWIFKAAGEDGTEYPPPTGDTSKLYLYLAFTLFSGLALAAMLFKGYNKVRTGPLR